MTVRDGVTWHDGSPFTRRGRGLVAGARRQGRDRQPDPVRLEERRQLQGRRQQDHRRCRPVRADAVQVDVVPHRLHPAEGLLREGRRRRLREGADRHRPLHGREVRAERLRAPQGQPELLGRQAGLRERDDQVRPRRGEPRRRDRIRQLAGDARNPLRGVRPADRQGRACRLGHHRLRHRHDLPERHRADDRQERAPGGGDVDRQEAAGRPAAARLRPADRHAGDAGIRGLRSVDQGRAQPGEGRSSC